MKVTNSWGQVYDIPVSTLIANVFGVIIYKMFLIPYVGWAIMANWMRKRPGRQVTVGIITLAIGVGVGLIL